ncbi:MAG TPA: BON domain-containing protein [Armatimonadota bacterium]|nr:BON domain-containing protein [Armatimonadota bacterium]
MGRLKDLETAAKIKLALMTNPHVGGLDIGVDTVNGIVMVSGAVQDRNRKNLAEEIARAYGGIDIKKNDIEVLGEAA